MERILVEMEEKRLGFGLSNWADCSAVFKPGKYEKRTRFKSMVRRIKNLTLHLFACAPRDNLLGPGSTGPASRG